eukprot:CAMPEP_0203663100 /NCGR_PEP_ID=MMETSP0090-20130426/822_1 /ASSEMBLY_ACC=CAM_ASM_001088 /TAXON_ID=426623 /ORGANISM="Chaetoceros affinis, Strain CCMP159" /LENGTH=1204 /DNA_ID=CAMNT_0050525967 /DNA_START=211 /DNA_END=3825 /DNA_ORIENTATION=-
MKLLSFSPWKHTTTSIPCSSPSDTGSGSCSDGENNNDDIVQQFIVSPFSSTPTPSHSSKRSKTSSSSLSSSSSSSSDMQPIMTLVSHHRLCILGRNDPQSRKTFLLNNLNHSGDNDDGTSTCTNDDRSSSTAALNQIPQWIYSSRPGDATSFFPNYKHDTKNSKNKHLITNGHSNKTNEESSSHPIHRHIGAVVDPTSRTIFVLQNDNRTMKVWGLDDDVNGPDDDSFGFGTVTADDKLGAFQNGTSPGKSNGIGNRNSNSNKKMSLSSSSSLIQKVEWDSPVLSMYPIPVKRQVRVKIKGQAPSLSSPSPSPKKRKGGNTGSSSGNTNIIQGGIVGLLENGQMFVVLVCLTSGDRTRNIKLGIYGNDNSATVAANFAENYLHSIVGFNILNTYQQQQQHCNKKGKGSSIVGQKKRKFSSDGNDDADNDISGDEWGELTLASLSKDAKCCDSIALSKHTLRISSTFTDCSNDNCIMSNKGNQQKQKQQNGTKSRYHRHQQQQQHHQTINGTYSREIGSIKLPHCIENTKSKSSKNGSSTILKKHKKAADILVTQFDPVHVGLVYQDVKTKVWYTTIIDTRSGECTVNPFPLRRINSTNMKSRSSNGVNIVNIGGLSNSILAVLATDNILSIYDVRRAVLLHEVNVHSMMRKEENGAEKKYTFGIATHWFNGTIGIICNELRGSVKKANGSTIEKKNNTSSTVLISYARVGIYDTDEKDEEVVGINKKPFAKGSYNLARIISSSLTTTETQVEAQPFVSNMINWYPSKKEHCIQSYESTLAESIEKLETYRPTSHLKDSSKTHSFFGIFEEIKEKLSKIQQTSSTTKLLNRKHSANLESSSECNSTLLPQALIDVSISVAIDIILAESTNGSHMASAVDVLLKCIETGTISGRNHFGSSATSNSRKKGEALRLLLLTLQSQGAVDDYVHWPLCLISSLLQHCKDGLTEQMLVSMVHFVLCYPSEKQFAGHWKNSGMENAWYKDSEANLLEKRLSKAMKEYDDAKARHEKRIEKKQRKAVKKGHDNTKVVQTHSKKYKELENLVKDLKNRCAVSHKLFFIRKIVTHSKCNPALLRSALQNGLTQTDSREVEVLMQALSKILRRDGKEHTISSNAIDSSQNNSTCISQWLSAVVDTNMGTLLNTGNSKTMEQVKKEVTASISQTQALLSLKDLLGQVSEMFESKKVKKGAVVEVSPVPLYGIEPLIF